MEKVEFLKRNFPRRMAVGYLIALIQIKLRGEYFHTFLRSSPLFFWNTGDVNVNQNFQYF